MRSKRRILVIAGVCCVLLLGVIIYTIYKQETGQNTNFNKNTISGVLIHRTNSRVRLLLTEPDQTNNIPRVFSMLEICIGFSLAYYTMLNTNNKRINV